MKKKSALLKMLAVAVALFTSVVTQAQITANANIDLRVGSHGLAHTLTLKVELVGGDRNDRILAEGELNPPEPGGYPADRVTRVPIRFNRAVNLRLVRKARLTVRGDRPGQPFTTRWEFLGMKLIHPDGTEFWRTPDAMAPVLINAANPSWETPGWGTYDPLGMKWKIPQLDLRVRTGADDLRDDASAGALVWFGDGSMFPVDLSQGKGIGRSQSRVASIRPRSYQSLDDVQGVFLLNMAFPWLTGATQKKLPDVLGYSNADSWNVGLVEMKASLPDGAQPIRPFNRLEGTYSGTVKGESSTRAIVPAAAVANYAGLRFRLVLLMDGTEYNLQDLNDLPELAAYVKLQGETAYRAFAVRTDGSLKYTGFVHERPIWVGPPTLRDFSGDRTSKMIHSFEARRDLWRDYPQKPIHEVQIRLMESPRADRTWSSLAYNGGRSVRLRGMLFGYMTGGSDLATIDKDLLRNYVVLGAHMHEAVELNRLRPTTSYRINHVMPGLMSKFKIADP